jgi:hypothetical protein
MVVGGGGWVPVHLSGLWFDARLRVVRYGLLIFDSNSLLGYGMLLIVLFSLSP